MTETLRISATAIADEIRNRVDEIEALRSLPSNISDRMAEAGFYRMCVPAAYGGLESHPAVMMDVVETLAKVDGSTAWCAFIGASSGSVLAYMDPSEARAMFDRPDRRFGGVFAPRGKARATAGDFDVSGRWQWGSGTQNADWIMGGCVVIRDGKPELLPSGTPRSRMFLAPASDVEFHDTWHVSGLSGTGSTDFSFNALKIPERRTADLFSPPKVETPLSRFPVFGLLAIGISCVGLGLARAAIDELLEFAGAKIPGMSARPLATRTRTQADVAEADALVRSARAYLFDAVEHAYERAQAGSEIDLESRRNVRLAASHATRASARAVDLMYALGGGTSVYRKSPLQRLFRDVHVATQHMIVGDMSWELVGRVLLGVETDTSML